MGYSLGTLMARRKTPPSKGVPCHARAEQACQSSQSASPSAVRSLARSRPASYDAVPPTSGPPMSALHLSRSSPSPTGASTRPPGGGVDGAPPAAPACLRRSRSTSRNSLARRVVAAMRPEGHRPRPRVLLRSAEEGSRRAAATNHPRCLRARAPAPAPPAAAARRPGGAGSTTCGARSSCLRGAASEPGRSFAELRCAALRSCRVLNQQHLYICAPPLLSEDCSCRDDVESCTSGELHPPAAQLEW